MLPSKRKRNNNKKKKNKKLRKEHADWNVPHIEDSDDDALEKEEKEVPTSSLTLWGKESQVAGVSEGDFELSKDDDEAEKFYRRKVTLAKMMKDGEDVSQMVEDVAEGRNKRIPLDLEPFVFANGEDPQHLVGEDLLRAITTSGNIFADKFASHFSQNLIESALSVSAAKASKNLELTAISEEDLQSIDEERRSRESDDKWLRTPKYELGERKCVKDDECEAFYWFGRHAVERLSDAELANLASSGEQPTGSRQMCVMCQRHFRLKLVIASLQNCGNMADIRPGFFNTVGIEGEYAMEQCIVGGGTPRHDPLFVVAHFPQCYSIQERGGVTYFVQDGYIKPENKNGGAIVPFV